MSSDNTKIVQKTKEILKEMGVEVKTTQIYEMYAKVLGYKNWNVLSSTTNSIIEEIKKKKDFKSLLVSENIAERVKIIQTLAEPELKSIISLIYAKMQCQVAELTLNDYGVTHVIQGGAIDVELGKNDDDDDVFELEMDESSDLKVAVVTKLSGDEKSLLYKKVTEKHLIRLKRFMDQHKCFQGVIYSSENQIPLEMYQFANEMGIKIVDYEDLLRMAMKADGLS